MSASPGASASMYQLDQVLVLLDAVSARETDEKKQQLAAEAVVAVTKLRCELQHSHLEQLASFVASREWDAAARALQQNFPDAAGTGVVVEKVLSLVYAGWDDDEHMYNGLSSAIKWVQHLQDRLRPLAWDALYKMIKSKGPDKFLKS